MTSRELQWAQVFQKNGIRVYKRDRQGSEFKEFKGVIEVPASLSAFGALLLDAPNMASWMHKTEEVRVLEQIADNERVAYMRFDFTPVGKRELIVRNKVTQDLEDMSVTYSMEHLVDHPELDGSRYGKIQGIAGFVRAKPVTDNSIEITYQCHVEPGIKMLEFWGASTVTNKLLSDTPYHTLRLAKREIADPRYRNAVLGFINEPELTMNYNRLKL